jgi:hypothetical protein
MDLILEDASADGAALLASGLEAAEHLCSSRTVPAVERLSVLSRGGYAPDGAALLASGLEAAEHLCSSRTVPVVERLSVLSRGGYTPPSWRPWPPPRAHGRQRRAPSGSASWPRRCR